MVSVQLATLVVALSGAGDTVLLDFHASWCAPCRAMDGTVAQLERAGYPVRRVDTDRQRALADQFHVQTIPCFVLLVDGKEAGRVTGAVRRDELVSLFAKAGVQPGQPRGALARGQSPDHLEPSDATVELAAESSGDPASPDRLIQASVRLKIEDPRGASYGSGTIIDARQGEALVLTCGHVFRDSQGKGRILVDLLGPGAPQQLSGRLVAYDLDNDLGLVSIRPGVPVEVAPVAPADQEIARGDRVVTVGCNNGGPATALESQINSINKFVGRPNLQVDGLPVEGRSGGGLFNADGLVIGVCNAADPADNEGLYAALALIHDQLDRAGLTTLYANRPQQTRPGPARTIVPVMADSMPEPGIPRRGETRQLATVSAATATSATAALSGREQAALAEMRDRADGAEVICIVRSLDDPQARSEVIMLDRASPAFIQQLSADRRAQAARHLTSLAVPARGPMTPVVPAQGVRWSSSSTEPRDRLLR